LNRVANLSMLDSGSGEVSGLVIIIITILNNNNLGVRIKSDG